jgi:hypothetical protein
MADDQSQTTLRRLQTFAERVGTEGDITLQWQSKHQEWLFAAEWGSEAPDSPMAGAATYGNDGDAMRCIEQALSDAGLGPSKRELKSVEQLLYVLDCHIRHWASVRQDDDSASHVKVQALAAEGGLQQFRSAVLADQMLDVSEIGYTGVDAIRRERHAQSYHCGFTAEHDDTHTEGELVMAAVAYALHGDDMQHLDHPPLSWPWEDDHWHPVSRRRSLEKAGALIAAELDRMDRVESRPDA